MANESEKLLDELAMEFYARCQEGQEWREAFEEATRLLITTLKEVKRIEAENIGKLI